MNTFRPSKKLIIVLNRLAGGGAETQVRRLSVALAGRGWMVTVVSLQEDVIEASELDEHGVNRVNLLGPRGFSAVRLLPALVNLLRREAPDVVLTMMIPADPLTRVAGYIAGVPVVSSIRNSFIGGPLVNFLLRFTDRLPAVITVNAEVTRDELGPKISASPRSIEFVPNALEAPTYRRGIAIGEAIREKLGITRNTFFWLAVGAQRPPKNYKSLLHAFSKVPAASALAIAGASYQQEELSSLVHELGIAERVWLLGRRNDIPELLASCDAFVQASLYEGTPNAVLEAMAAARPVVATAVGGVPDTIRHGQSGWIVSAGDIGALRSQMYHVMQLSHVVRSRVADRGRDHVERVHATESVTDQWEVLLNRVMKQPPSQY